MYKNVEPSLQKELQEIEAAGLYKKERIIVSPQGAEPQNPKTPWDVCRNLNCQNDKAFMQTFQFSASS